MGNEKDLTKAQQEQLKIDFDTCVFISTSKVSQQKLKTLKRFIKILCSSLVDLYPAKKELLPALVTEVKNFSKSKMRVIRFCFTQIGL